MKKIKFTIRISLLLAVFIGPVYGQKKTAKPVSERQVWLKYMDEVARPIIFNLAENQLKEKMPMLMSDHIDNKVSRAKVGYLEAFGRTLSGIAPWLELEGGDADETSLRNEYRKQTLKAIANAVNPEAKDYLQWTGGQPLVDASFFALGLVRSPWLWHHLDEHVQKQVIDALISTRATVPVYSNWILFSGMIETFFCKYDLPYDPLRVEFGVKEFTKHWYAGDGMYSDGMNFHQDYYNSIVIQPYLSLILKEINAKKRSYPNEEEKQVKIGQRYAEIQERTINMDGTYPIIGRSIVYRGGVFHHLANMAYLQQLPASLKPAQVRCALAAVIKKTLGAPATFSKDGWLSIGLYGPQPSLADVYITSGSLYICSEIFLPLGLPDTNAFWTTPDEPWTAVKVWTGQDTPADHALDIKN
ncbi:DUF2264 domain-containing protein [Mucilaginibacter sp. HMF5004]|nr:DUF2264 domain-containing protein [Mucilaginibacter rivuli]